MSEIDFSYRTEWRDFLATQFLHLRPRRFIKWTAAVLVILFAAVGATQFQRWQSELDLGTAIAVSFVFLVIVVSFFHGIRKSFRQNKFLHHQQVVRADEAGLHFKSDLGESNIPWDHFLKWKENDRLFLLYFGGRQCFAFPKRAFSAADLPSFSELLASRVVKKVC